MNWAKQGVLFKLPLCKTAQFQCTYFYRTARLWNTLPFVIRDAGSLQIFKKNLIYTDFKYNISVYLDDILQGEWNINVTSKLFEVQPIIKRSFTPM